MTKSFKSFIFLIVLSLMLLNVGLVSAGAILVDVRALNQTGGNSYSAVEFVNETAAGQYSYTLLVMNVTARDLDNGYFSVGIRGLVIYEFPYLNLTGRWINMTFRVKSRTNTFTLDGQGVFFPLYIVSPKSKTLFHLGERLKLETIPGILGPPSNWTMKLVRKYVKVYPGSIEVSSTQIRSRDYFNYTICNTLPLELQRELDTTKESECFVQPTPCLIGSFSDNKPLSIMALYPRDPFGIFSSPVLLSVRYIPSSPDELMGRETSTRNDLLKKAGAALIIIVGGAVLLRRGGR